MKNFIFEKIRENIFNKDIAIRNHIEYMIVRCLEMFKYENLPSTIPEKQLEKMLIENGKIFFMKKENEFYVFDCEYTENQNVYNEYDKVTISNVALNFSGVFEHKKDGIIIHNDSKDLGLIPIIAKYGVQLVENDITLTMTNILSRIQYFISSADNRTKTQAEIFINKLLKGDFAVISDNAFLESLKVHNTNIDNKLLSSFIELDRYLKGSLFNELGISANFELKKERMINAELTINDDMLIPLSENMLDCRKQAIEEINKMFDLNIKVNLSSIWKKEYEAMNEQTEENKSIVENTNDFEKSDSTNTIKSDNHETNKKNGGEN